jgi:transposase
MSGPLYVSVVLAQSLTEIRRVAHPAVSAERETSQAHARRPVRTRAVQQTQLARQEERQQRYQTIIALRHQGMNSKEIAVRVGMGERTVRHWLSSRGLPYAGPRNPRPLLIDPYIPYLLTRWQEGCHKGSQLEKEVRARGYTGSQRGIYRYLETLETSAFKSVSRRSVSPPTPVEASALSNPALTLSGKPATWLFFRKRADLKEEELAQLHALLRINEGAKTAHHLVETFLSMIRERTGERLDAWLEAVQQAGSMPWRHLSPAFNKTKMPSWQD